MEIIGYHTRLGEIASSRRRSCTESPFLDFLLEDEPAIKCLYNLNYNVACVLKMIGLTETEGKKLLDKGRIYLSPYTLKYIPGKLFSIDKGFGAGHPFAIFSDMSQYRNQAVEISPEIGAGHAAITGIEVYYALKSLKLNPSTLTSPIRVFEKEIMSKLDLPTVSDIPEEAGEYAYECCAGSWLEAYQLGHFPLAYDYDISSAYPHFASQLPDLRQGRWIKADDMPLGAKLGYMKGKVTIDAEFSPILYRDSGNIGYTPVGTWPTKLTLAVADFILTHSLGKFEIEDGWFWIPNSSEKIRRPLESVIRRLYRAKESADGLKREVIKRIMAGIYGKMLEVRQYEEVEMGPFFNPVWAAEIETNTQLEVARFALSNGILPLHVAVDGLLLSREVPIGDSGAMGSWKLTACSPAIVAGSGVVAIKNRKGEGDFALDYDWLTGEIGKDPQASEYEMRKLSPVTLAKAINENKFDRLGELEEITRVVSCDYEFKRAYQTMPYCWGDLMKWRFEGMPWNADIVKGGLQC